MSKHPVWQLLVNLSRTHSVVAVVLASCTTDSFLFVCVCFTMSPLKAETTAFVMYGVVYVCTKVHVSPIEHLQKRHTQCKSLDNTTN